MKRAMLGVLVLAVCGMMVGPVGMAGKPQPPPAYVEPTDDLVISDSLQLLAVSDGYARVWDWDDSTDQFVHIFSGTSVFMQCGVIGDVDNDGTKEVLAVDYAKTGKGKNVVYTYTLRIWWDGDAADSSSVSMNLDSSVALEIGDVDNDQSNELIMENSEGDIQVWECDSADKSLTKVATIPAVGLMGLTIGDADDDNTNELIVGGGLNNYAHGVVLKYIDGSYNVVGDLGPKDTQCVIDEVSIGDIDGDGKNELLGTGYNNKGTDVFIWRYDSTAKEYKQIWTTQRTDKNGGTTAIYHYSNEIADIDGDGTNEAMFSEQCQATQENYLVVLKSNGDDKWSEDVKYSGFSATIDSIMSCDIDGDTGQELMSYGRVWDWNDAKMEKIQTLAFTNAPQMSLA